MQAVHIWNDVTLDPTVSVVVLTGRGKAFCAGGDFEMIENFRSSPKLLYAIYEEARSIVKNMIDCPKVIELVTFHARTQLAINLI